MSTRGVGADAQVGGRAWGRQAASKLRGRIRFSASSNLTRQQLRPLLDGFVQQHLGVELHLNIGDRLEPPTVASHTAGGWQAGVSRNGPAACAWMTTAYSRACTAAPPRC